MSESGAKLQRLNIGVNKIKPTFQPINNERSESAQFLRGRCGTRQEVEEWIIVNPTLLHYKLEICLSSRQNLRKIGDIVSEYLCVSSGE